MTRMAIAVLIGVSSIGCGSSIVEVSPAVNYSFDPDSCIGRLADNSENVTTLSLSSQNYEFKICGKSEGNNMWIGVDGTLRVVNLSGRAEFQNNILKPLATGDIQIIAKVGELQGIGFVKITSIQ